MKKLIFVAFAASFLSGCAIGPLVSHETARSVGKSNSEFVGGYGLAGYVFKFNHGVTENLDLGIHLESLSWGIRGKYAFINNQDGGWSLATALGLGASIGGSHYYGDIMGSYLKEKWEPYATLRIVHVKNDPMEFKDEDTGEVDFKVELEDYDYGQAMFGARYWFKPTVFMTVEASSLFAISSGLNIGGATLIGGGVGLRF